jgi:hypothetical protein
MTPLMTDARNVTPTTTAIDALAAPSNHGEILIAPSANQLLSAVRSNRALRSSYDFRLLDRSVTEWLSDRTRGDAPLVVMSGHQPEFFHPGVWIKHVAAIRLAERLGGSMQFLVVDSDVPGVIRLDWPVVTDGFATIQGARAASVMDWRSYEYIRDRKDIDYAAIFDVAEQQFAGSDASNLRVFADAMTQSGFDNYVDRWIAGLCAFDASLGIPTANFSRIGRLFDFSDERHDPAAAALVAHVILNAHEFRCAYNDALFRYRTRRNIAGNQHPIPDLSETERRIECPFWLTHAAHGRARLHATPCKRADCVTIFAGDRPLADIQTQELIESPSQTLSNAIGDWRIRPRALAQTLYARLFACDLFIHGIGGAKYDQITDDLVRQFLGVEPPKLGCVSATCRLALPTFGVTPTELSDARRALRDSAYNPQRYASVAKLAKLEPLFDERRAAIAESGQLRQNDPTDRRARRAAFDRIHEINRRILESMPAMRETMKSRLAQLSREAAHNRIAMNREWFFALYPTERLSELRDSAWECIDAASPVSSPYHE